MERATRESRPFLLWITVEAEVYGLRLDAWGAKSCAPANFARDLLACGSQSGLRQDAVAGRGKPRPYKCG